MSDSVIEDETIGDIHLNSLVPTVQGTGGTVSPGLMTRFVALIRSSSLDRELIAGRDPSSSTQLAAHVARLTNPRTRVLIAEGLERLIQAAQGPQQRWSAVGRRDPLVGNINEIRELAELLRSETPLYARGIAILNQFLSDGTGCAYHGESRDIADRLDGARVALQG